MRNDEKYRERRSRTATLAKQLDELEELQRDTGLKHQALENAWLEKQSKPQQDQFTRYHRGAPSPDYLNEAFSKE
jgi:hypothetical protein